MNVILRSDATPQIDHEDLLGAQDEPVHGGPVIRRHLVEENLARGNGPVPHWRGVHVLHFCHDGLSADGVEHPAWRVGWPSSDPVVLDAADLLGQVRDYYLTWAHDLGRGAELLRGLTADGHGLASHVDEHPHWVPLRLIVDIVSIVDVREHVMPNSLHLRDVVARVGNCGPLLEPARVLLPVAVHHAALRRLLHVGMLGYEQRWICDVLERYLVGPAGDGRGQLRGRGLQQVHGAAVRGVRVVRGHSGARVAPHQERRQRLIVAVPRVLLLEDP
mmetsp:Transcript_64448/g.174126  ORF Transcript_64448/g.174126 Transcript_64448/m.174126 type:complete len:275 (-) Transcript_64448:265-1089(-)